MKSRTLSSELTVFRKDITRFAPVWVLYSVFLLLALMVLYSNSHDTDLTNSVVGFSYWMIVVNLIYAMFCAQVLFGDLFNSRMCNALHALPARRESWFGIHTLSGLLFSLIPNFLFTLLLTPGCGVTGWFWLLQSTLQFVFFFGTAVLCALLVGSRFAMVVVYGLINFGALLIYWLMDTLYLPLLPGVIMDLEVFRYFSPTVNFFAQSPMDVDYLYRDTYKLVLYSDGWLYLAIVAAVGVAFSAVALVLYRRRNLETAGDFIAVNALKPVFLISYTFVIAAFFHLVYQMFIGSGDWIFMLLGIAVGYFTAQMFLMRTAKVFKKKTLAGFAVFALAVVASLGITMIDPLGITRWVPDSEDVASVELGQNYNEVELSDPALLSQVEEFHKTVAPGYRGAETGEGHPITLYYKLKNGLTLRREYWIDEHSEEGEILLPVISSPEFVLGEFLDWEDMDTGFNITYYDGDERLVDRSLYPELMACIIRDCREGNLPQRWWEWNDATTEMELTFEYQVGRNNHRYLQLTVTDEAEHTVKWLRQQKFYWDWTKYHNG